MGGDAAGAGTRERIWVTKVDHSTEPPRPVEEVFIENGVIMARKDLTKADAADAAAVAADETLPNIVPADWDLTLDAGGAAAAAKARRPAPAQQQEEVTDGGRGPRERARWE